MSGDGKIPEGARPTTGALATYLKMAATCTDAPEMYHLGAGMIVLSSILGSHIYLKYGPGKLYPNLWIALVGRSSLDRKSTVIRIARRELKEIDKQAGLPSEFSRERLEELMKTTNHGTMFWFEMSNALSLLERDYMSGTKAMLTEWYDGDPYSRQTKQGGIEIDATPLSILAGTTLEWWEASMRRSDLAGGFLPRWNVISCTAKGESDPFPPHPPQALLEEVKAGFSAASYLEGEVTFSESARKAYSNWYRLAEKSALGLEVALHAVWSRLSTACLKFAMIYAAAEGRTDIQEADLKKSAELSAYFMTTTHALLGRLATDRESQDVREAGDIIRAAFPEPIKRSDLMRKSRLSARRLDGALKTLMGRDEVLRTPFKTNGRSYDGYRFHVPDA